MTLQFTRPVIPAQAGIQEGMTLLLTRPVIPAQAGIQETNIKMKKFQKFLLLIRDTISGDFAYKNYLKHCGKNLPLSKKDFLRKREKTKWERVNRCC